MVFVIKDWKVMKEHISDYPYCEVYYKIDYIGEKARVRIKAGKMGFDKTYDPKDHEFDEIVRFLDSIDAIVVVDQKNDDVFFM